MIIKDVHRRFDDAVIALMFNHPFYASIYLMMDVHPDEECKTAWTDGRTIGWSPKFFEALTIHEILGVIVHELLHVIFKHHLRQLECAVYLAMHEKYNVAADYAINPQIATDPGMKLPDGCLLDMDRWSDTTLDVVFHQLKDSQIPKNFTGGMGEVRPMTAEDGEPLSPTERAEAEAVVDSMVKAAVQKAQGVGKMPGHLGRMVDKAVTPREQWEQHLQMLVEMICRDDYTWTMPNPRYISSGIYLPILKSEGMPDLVFVVDTSGSMDRPQLEQIMAEIARILETYMCRVIVLYVDTKVQGFEEFEGAHVRAGDFILDAKGGGGTRFKPAFEWIANNDEIDPAAIIYFTDLENSESEWKKIQEPDVPVLWGMLPGYNGFEGRYRDRVTFGDVIEVHMENR
jgi:predicted metal-dependent peptidase